MSSDNLIYSVPGVNCEHCRVAISNEVAAVSGVDSVEVDLEKKLVSVQGTGLEEAEVRAAIDEAGYDVAEGEA